MLFENFENRNIDVVAYCKFLEDNLKIIIPNSCIKFLKIYGNAKYRNEKTYMWYHFECSEIIYFNKHDFLQFINSNNMTAAPIGYIYSELLGSLTLIMNEFEEIYILERKQKIADSLDHFWELMFSSKFYIECIINENTLGRLKKSGWYPNRNIDISSFIDVLSKNGYTVFESAVKFFKEFYGLSGMMTNKERKWKILNEHQIVQEYTPDYLEDGMFKYYHPKEMYLPICVNRLGENIYEDITYYITNDGMFYSEQGSLLGNNSLEFFNSLFRH